MDSYGTWSTNASCSRVNASSRGGPSYSPIPIRCRKAVVSMPLRLGEVIDVLDRTAALAIAPELGEVFAAAFGAPGYDEEPDPGHFATDQLPTHADRDDFRLVAARSDGSVVGFAYGFTGQRGQWWSDRIANAVTPELADEW